MASIAATVTSFGRTLSLVGAFGFSIGGLIIPGLLHWRCLGTGGNTSCQKLTIVCVCMFAVVVTSLTMIASTRKED